MCRVVTLEGWRIPKIKGGGRGPSSRPENKGPLLGLHQPQGPMLLGTPLNPIEFI